jgi:adenine-specific DNA-methyltransferase
MNLNAADGGDRRFVVVQLPYETNEQEKASFNTCHKITRVRVERVIEGYSYVETNGESRKVEVEPLGGSFTYARVGEPLFGEYRDFGKTLPSYEEVAKYVFYTETSREIDLKNIDEKSGLVGATDVAGGTSYYLLYTPDKTASREMSLTTLGQLLKKDKRRHWVVYCEKIWLHPEDLRKFERENDKRVRPMLVPFDLK